MKKKRLLIVIVIVVIALLLFPVTLYADDGGSEEHRAVLYSVTYRHSMFDNMAGFDWYRTDIEEGTHGFLTGTLIEIFGKTVWDNTEFKTPDECGCKRCR